MAINWNTTYRTDDDMAVRNARAVVNNLRNLYDSAVALPLPEALVSDLAEIDTMETKALAALSAPAGGSGAQPLVEALGRGVADPLADTDTLVELHDVFLHRTANAYPRLRVDVADLMSMHRAAAWASHSDALMAKVREAAAPHVATVKEFTDAAGAMAVKALAADEDDVAIARAGAENLTRWALAVEANKHLRALRDFIRMLNRHTGDNQYTYTGGLVWADLTYQQERALHQQFRHHLEAEGTRLDLTVWHVLAGGYTVAIASGEEFATRTAAYLAAREQDLAAKAAAKANEKPDITF